MRNESILFSVIIPTYNSANFLKTALSSVIRQSYQKWEAIIVDNNSSDNTAEVIDSFKDGRIRVVSINNNGVIAASRNLGIKESNGDWVAFLDSDDKWYAQKLSIIHRCIKDNPQFDVVTNDEYVVTNDKKKKKILRYGPLPKDSYKNMLFFGNKLSTSATVVKKNFLDINLLNFNEEKDFVTVEDYDFWLNLSRHKANFKFIHEIMGEYLIHESNNSKREEVHKKNNINLLKYHALEIQDFEKDRQSLFKKIMFRLNLHSELSELSTRNFHTKIFKIIKLIIQKPFFSFSYLIEKILSKITNYFLSFKR